MVVQDYRQVREDGMEFYGHGVFLAQGEEVWWWFFDSYRGASGAGRRWLGGR